MIKVKELLQIRSLYETIVGIPATSSASLLSKPAQMIDNALSWTRSSSRCKYMGSFMGKDIVQWYRTQDADDDEICSGNAAVGLPPVESVDMGEKTAAWLSRSLDSFDSQTYFADLNQNEWQEAGSSFEVSEECCSVEV